ncbi:nuclear chaperone required for maturation and nuclear export of pre-60s ribosome subunits [Trichomonas vaginalis G3]|uniref:nuclear chaperone required for maturation and nuclear export of pre-60s ribosome subunits n=1 Tax=Trichomonas vaginalis (strain ATCC PRA-98 / G3) TaxID=412133 RepID=UPI0021E56798|nr:nuclear chaperone required for maturation and nuclear export of pre-60s ribosome subunits [Trichomonas vaginalis G3]KAI5544716.1 nuclear chaperone required for maturation and nuclear export of pre-60s ribosome subunits [Trichomonas vaginalis G3]
MEDIEKQLEIVQNEILEEDEGGQIDEDGTKETKEIPDRPEEYKQETDENKPVPGDQGEFIEPTGKLLQCRKDFEFQIC